MNRLLIIGILTFAFSANAFTCREVEAAVGAPKGYVFIVDPFSSGNQLAVPFLNEGIYPIYVRSNLDLPARTLAGYRPGDFLSDLPPQIKEALASGDQKRIENAILELKHGWPDLPLFIIPGQEAGVTLAEKLAAKFHLEYVEPDAIKSHRSKPHMHWMVAKAGIEIIPMTLAHNEKEVFDWIEREFGSIAAAGGVVLKTGSSHSGTQVFPCRNEQSVRDAVKALKGKNAFGIENKSFMVQPFIRGREFAVNSVSVMGPGGLHTVITEVWEYIKPAPPAYGYEVLLSPDEIPPGLLEMHHKVKEALKYRGGAGHGEYFVTPEGKIFLGEIAARMYGAGNTAISGASTHYGQVQGVVESLLYPERVLARPNAFSAAPYTVTHRAAVFNVNAPESDVPLYPAHEVIAELKAELGENLFKLIDYTQPKQQLNASSNLIDTMAQIEIRVPEGPRSKEIRDEIINKLQKMQADGVFWRTYP